MTHSATSRPYKGFQTPISSEGTKQRSRGEILAALEDRSLTSRTRKKELVKALLEAGPLSFLAALAKPIPGARRFLSRCLPWSLKYRGVYFSFEDARAHAPKDVPLGYDHHEIASGYKDQRFLSSDYPAAFWLREALRDGATVFDLGGSVGISFYTWEHYFSYPDNLRWVVCDVPAVIQAGKKLPVSEMKSGCSFTSQLEDADSCNCLLASGSLQYIECRSQIL